MNDEPMPADELAALRKSLAEKHGADTAQSLLGNFEGPPTRGQVKWALDAWANICPAQSK